MLKILPGAMFSDDPVHIGGCMRYGDNVEDEWTALSLLVSITRSYTNTVARAWDSDGEVSFHFTNLTDKILTCVTGILDRSCRAFATLA